MPETTVNLNPQFTRNSTDSLRVSITIYLDRARAGPPQLALILSHIFKLQAPGTFLLSNLLSNLKERSEKDDPYRVIEILRFLVRGTPVPNVQVTLEAINKLQRHICGDCVPMIDSFHKKEDTPLPDDPDHPVYIPPAVVKIDPIANYFDRLRDTIAAGAES